MYADPTGDTDDSGDFFNLYTYDLSRRHHRQHRSRCTPATSPKAVSAHDAVVTDAAAPSGFSAVHLSERAAHGPRRAGPRRHPDLQHRHGTTALAAAHRLSRLRAD